MKTVWMLPLLFATAVMGADVHVDVDSQKTTASRLTVYKGEEGTIQVNFFRDNVAASQSGPLALWYGTNGLQSDAIWEVTGTVSGVNAVLGYGALDFPVTIPGNRAWRYGVSVNNKVQGDGELFIKQNPYISDGTLALFTRTNIVWAIVSSYMNTATHGPVRPDGVSITNAVNPDGSITLYASVEGVSGMSQATADARYVARQGDYTGTVAGVSASIVATAATNALTPAAGQVLATNAYLAAVAAIPDVSGFLTAESDPNWASVSNAVTVGAAAGATALQAEADPVWGAASNAVLYADGSVSATGPLDMGGQLVTNLVRLGWQDGWKLEQLGGIDSDTFVFIAPDGGTNGTLHFGSLHVNSIDLNQRAVTNWPVIVGGANITTATAYANFGITHTIAVTNVGNLTATNTPTGAGQMLYASGTDNDTLYWGAAPEGSTTPGLAAVLAVSNATGASTLTISASQDGDEGDQPFYSRGLAFETLIESLELRLVNGEGLMVGPVGIPASGYRNLLTNTVESAFTGAAGVLPTSAAVSNWVSGLALGGDGGVQETQLVSYTAGQLADPWRQNVDLTVTAGTATVTRTLGAYLKWNLAANSTLDFDLSTFPTNGQATVAVTLNRGAHTLTRGAGIETNSWAALSIPASVDTDLIFRMVGTNREFRVRQ
jgi:hypothetical protein